jgi:hypothetical protein
VSDPAAPFGGVKPSGLGREGGTAGLLEYTEMTYLGAKGEVGSQPIRADPRRAVPNTTTRRREAKAVSGEIVKLFEDVAKYARQENEHDKRGRRALYENAGLPLDKSVR